jgi:hypothetical protein
MVTQEQEQERIAKTVLDCAFEVHSVLGPGLLERTYQSCLLNVKSFKNSVQRIIL